LGKRKKSAVTKVGHEAEESTKKAGTSLEEAGNRGASDIKGSIGGGKRRRRTARKKKRRRRRKVGGFSLFGKSTSDDGKPCIPGVPGQCGMGTKCVKSGFGIGPLSQGKCMAGGKRKKKSKRHKKSHRRRTHRRRRRR